MLMFRVLGSWVRGLYLLGFGAFWLFISYYLRGASGTMSYMGGIGALMMLSGGIVIMRGLAMTSFERAPLPKGSTGWRDDGKPLESDTGFDADAAIARYLEKRPHGDPQPVETPQPESVAAAPPRPSFGRKQA